MALEVERKFLIEEIPDWLARCEKVEIDQEYLAIGEESEVRVRRAGDARLITAKRGRGETREELEVELSVEQYEALRPAAHDEGVSKRRHLVPLEGGLCAEVDVYSGALDGLAVAEVEFASEAQSHEFRPPPWFGREVTGDGRYANQALATEGRPGIEDVDTGPSRAYRLKRKEETAEGIRRIALGRVDQALEGLRKVDDGDSAASIHEVRKDLKKVRAVVRLVRAPIGEDAYDSANARFRDAGRALSASRDADVKLQTLDSLLERFDDLPAETVEEWRQGLEQDRAQTGEEERAAAVSRAVALIEVGRDGILSWELKPNSWGLIEHGLLRSYRRGRWAMRSARSEPDEASFHEWRKRVKDLWYHQRLLRNAWKGPLEEAADQAHELADLLGHHHDLSVLRQDLSERPVGDKAAKSLRAALLTRQEELGAAAIDLGERVYAEKPNPYRRRIRRYWRAWRDE